ncbi:phosphoribosyltransferase family protein [Kitasatospora sp. NBC_00240]|uniref:phosphoribosyltransferase family protein n=1 Tax=Kitasatospora sp. NBC_00240 TaxID=2903567 RepID=UPI002257C615|nr:phosphoribosyltransferase family protein [Kitasatospora sp. NBC_00240]MCX5209693.1 phosphoribosyltransferase family protein [Kitasatospora sp. NBC_00240]
MHFTDTHFTDRTDAGRQLAARLGHLRGEHLVVVALPRGGVPVAAEVADALDAPLDICVIRKLGVPYQPELGMGAIGEDGARVINDQVVRMAGVSPRQIAEVERSERAELERRAGRYRGGRAPADLNGRTVLVVDDGVATGSTARAACEIVRARGAALVVLAVPVAPKDWTVRLGDVADQLVCVATPSPFFAIGEFYEDFTQTEDAEVLRCLSRFAGPPGTDREVTVLADGSRLGGRLTVPDGATGVVVFAHGSGSSRHSPRNRFVAEVLNRAGLATLLFDLLTEAEEPDRQKVFDVALLGGRLAQVTDRLTYERWAAGLPFGYFGASTGAAAALWAAGQDGAQPAAVVSRGGRPDLAGSWLGRVRAPTLLIVGGRDPVVIELNERARERLRCPNELAVVPHATHLFEEPGTLAAAAGLARDWFLRYLSGPAGPGPERP